MRFSLTSLLSGRQQASSSAALTDKGSRQAKVCIPRDARTGDPRRMTYADPAVYQAIESVTAKAHSNAQRLHEEAINALYPGAFASSASTKDVCAITQTAYDHMDLAAARKLEADLLRQGFPLPGKSWTYRAVAKTDKVLGKLAQNVDESAAPALIKRAANKSLPKMGAAVRDMRDRPLNYPQTEHMRDRRVYFHTLKRSDKYDTAAQNLTKSERNKRLALERQLVYYQRMYDSVHAYLQEGAVKLAQLFVYDTGTRGVRMLARNIGALDQFFKAQFNVSADRRASKSAARQLREAGNNPIESEQVLRRHLSNLLSKVPLGLGEGTGQAAGNGLLGLAEAYAMEIGIPRKREPGDEVLQVDKSVWLAPCRDHGEADGSFKLVQPFGQDDWALRSKQLIATKVGTSSGNDYKIELKTFAYYVEEPNASGALERRYVPATGFDNPDAVIKEELISTEEVPSGEDGMKVLRQHFSINNLELFFDEGRGLGRDDYQKLAGRVAAKRMLNEKSYDIVCKYVDQERDQYLEQTNVTSAQETGYFFNSGMYGENLCVKSRERVMDRFSRKVPVVGSCGSHQRVAADHGRPIIALEHLPPYLKFLLSRHGSDPYTLGEPGKQTIGAYKENTLAAGVMETPLEIVPYAPGARRAEPGRPVAQSTDRPLKTRDMDGTSYYPLNQRDYIDPEMESRIAQGRRLWRPRDAANLSLHLRMSADDAYEQPFNFYQPLPAIPRLAHPTPDELSVTGSADAQSTPRVTSRRVPVQVSENLKLRAAVMRDGTRLPISEAMLTLDRVRELCGSDDFSHLEMTHEIPEGWALCDDNRRVIRDDEGSEVRALETVIIRPQLVATTRKGIAYEPDPHGRMSPVYEDERQVRVYPKVQSHSGEPEFEDEFGGKAAGPVRLRHVEVDDKESELRFEIAGIERWIRVPMPVEPGSQVAGTKKGDGKADKVLCTYRKVKVDDTDRNFNQALYSLRDNLYYEMNCIHSQNPVSDSVQEVPGPEEVAVSVVPNDQRMPRTYMSAWSRQNPRTHAIHVDWMAPIQSLILEGLENSSRGNSGFLVTLHTHQGHRDMGTDDMGIRLHPDHLTDHSGKVDKKYLAQLQGNLEGIFASTTRSKVSEIVTEINSAATESRAERTAVDRINEATLTAAENALREIDQAWRAYSKTRRMADADSVIEGLTTSGHPQLLAVAEALSRNRNGWAAQGGTEGVFNAVAQDVAALSSMLASELDAPARSSVQLQRETKIRAVIAILHDLDADLRAVMEEVNGNSAQDMNFYARVTGMQNRINEIHRQLDGDETLGTATEFVYLRASVDALAQWEREPEMLRREVGGALSQQRKMLAAGEEVTVSRESVLSPAHILGIRDQELLQNGRRRPALSQIRTRNDALATRYLSDASATDSDARYTPLFRLFLEQDYLPAHAEVEEDGAAYRARRLLYWQEKDGIVLSLRQRIDEIEGALPSLRQDTVLNKQGIRELEQEKLELKTAVSAWELFRVKAVAEFEMGDDVQRKAWLTEREASLASIDAALRETNEAILIAGSQEEPTEADSQSAMERLVVQRARLLQERLGVRREIRQAGRIVMLEEGRDWLADPEQNSGAVAQAKEKVDNLRAELALVGGHIAKQEGWLEAMQASPSDRPQILEQMRAARNDSDVFSTMGLDELIAERDMLMAELADARELSDNMVSIVSGLEPIRAPGPLARMGYVVQTDGATVSDGRIEEVSEATAAPVQDEINDEGSANWSQQVQSLALALAKPDGPERAQAIDNFVAISASNGLLEVLFPGSQDTSDDRIATAVRILSDSAFVESMKVMLPAESAGIQPQAIYALLTNLRSQLGDAMEASQGFGSGKGRQKINYPDRTRRTQIAGGLYASMAANAATAGTFAQVKEAIGLASEQAAKSLSTAEAATALSADGIFGAIQIAAGVNLVKDASYTLRHLDGKDSGTRAVVQGAIDDYNQLAGELTALLRELQEKVNSVSDGDGQQEKQRVLGELGEMLDGRLAGYHYRLQLIRQEILAAKVNAATGGTLVTAMSAILASATAKAVSAAENSHAAYTAFDISGWVAIAAGALYTTLGLMQAGLSGKRVRELRELTEELAFRMGYGVDSGERRAGNARLNELLEMAERQRKDWGFFTFGGVLVTIGGSLSASGLPLVGAPLNLVGSWLISGAVVHLYKLPLDLRGKDARAAFSTTHIDDGFLTTNRRWNQLGSCNRDKAAIQQETMWKFGRDVFDKNDDKAMRRTYLKAWFKPGAPRVALTRAILPSLDEPASIQVQYDLMQRTNVAELNWRHVEVEERTKDLEKGMQALQMAFEALQNARAAGGEQQSSGASAEQAGEGESISLANTFFHNLQNYVSHLDHKLQEARRARTAAEALQGQLQAFSAELGRVPDTRVLKQLQGVRLRWMLANNVFVPALGEKDARRMFQDFESVKNVAGEARLSAVFGGRLYGTGTTGDASSIPRNAKLERVEIDASDQTCEWIMQWLMDKLGADQVNALFVRAMVDCLPEAVAMESAILGDIHIKRMVEQLKRMKAEEASATPAHTSETRERNGSDVQAPTNLLARFRRGDRPRRPGEAGSTMTGALRAAA